MTVTNPMTRTTPTIPPPRRGGWLKMRWRDFVNYSRGTTTRRNVWIGGLVVAVGFWLVSHQQDELAARALDRAAVQTATDDYQNARAAYDNSVAIYVGCVGDVDAYTRELGQWEQTISAIERLNPAAADSPFISDLRQGPVFTVENPPTLDQCAPPGDPPVDPNA